MGDEIPVICVERGEGYWCYHVHKPPEGPPMVPSGGLSDMDSPTYDEQLVYRPVKVGVNDAGEAYAYYYDEDMSFEEMLKTGAKRFVPPRQVYAEPLSGAEPAYKHKPKSPP